MKLVTTDRIVWTVLVFTTLLNSKASAGEKKLIEFGWDEPDTAFMRAHVREMEQTPFDGCVFNIMYANPDGSKGSFMNECWSKRAFTRTEMQPTIDDLKTTKFKRFTDNFLRFNVCPGDVDWFNDKAFASVASNAKLAAQIAREGNAKGILFDIEPYNAPLWQYSKLREAHSKSFDAYCAQAHKRGREFMRAVQDGYPHITIFLTFGYTLAMEQCHGDRAKLPTIEYGLLPAFLDGMLDVAQPGVRIIDGYEISYGFKEKSEFEVARRHLESDVLPWVADPKRYRGFFKLGFGIWMDFDWRKHGWDVENPQKNFFTPESLEKSIRAASEVSDEYVWVYTESPKWWTASGKPEKLPKQYVDAVRRASGR
jgi:hypothetical protein